MNAYLPENTAAQRIADATRQHLNRLSLERIKLQRLPDAVRDLRHLETLSVEHCDLERRPAWIGELTALKHFFAICNHLVVLPAVTTLTVLYTTPGCCRATIDTLTICNRSAVATTFRISVAPKGAADAVAHYIYYDTTIAANATLNLNELNIRLTETDELRVYAAAANLSFSAFGTETL